MSLKLTGEDDELYRAFYALEAPRDVAKLLDVQYDRLIYHLHKTNPNTRYTSFEIPKKSGGTREILSPVTGLKIIQRKLNQVLQSVCVRKPQVHGFVYGKSILTNAKEHSKKRLVLKVDLKNFFPTINFGRVRGMFLAYPYNRNPAVATILTQICCFDNRLPQGAPTSPVVSNMICAKMDSELLRMAERIRCTFTRYADDLTFSTSRRMFPYEVVIFNATTKEIKLGAELKTIIERNSFEVNHEKTRIFPYHQRQMVTGLITNKAPNVTRKYVNQIRAMLHAWQTYGHVEAQKHYYERYDQKHRSSTTRIPSFPKIVQGKIEFLGHIRGSSDKAYIKFRNELQPLISQLGKAGKSNLYWFVKKDLNRYQLTLDFEDNLGIRLLPDTESQEIDGYLQIHEKIVCIEMCTEDKPLGDTSPRKLCRRVLMQKDEDILRRTYEAHVPNELTYQGEMGHIVTRYASSVGKIVVNTLDGTQKCGTGFVVSRRNLLMTAAHVVDPNEVILNFVEFEKVQIKCKILRLDRDFDVAILELEHEVEVWPLKIRQPLQMPQDRGMRCVTIGFPDEPGYIIRSVPTELFITGLTGNYLRKQELLGLSTSLGSGTSGSPILNKSRSLIGMVIGFGSSELSGDTIDGKPRERQKWSAGAVSCNDLQPFIQEFA